MNLKERDLKVGSLRTAVQSGGVDLANARDLLAWVIEKDAWRKRIDMYNDTPYSFERFDDFVTTAAPGGLGSTVDDLERLVRGTPVELALREARKASPGRQAAAQSTDNIRGLGRKAHGTTRAYAMDRLRRERPDLLTRVNAGELSANAAAIEAGFRKPKATIPVHSADAAVEALLRRFTTKELRAALARRSS